MTRPSLSSERGFTIIETMVAMVVLVVGLIGVASMMDHAVQASVSTKAREGGVTLQRELIEAARGISYDSLTQAAIVSQIRAANPGLADVGDPGWQIKRRGFTYTVSVGACSVDDPSDQFGTHDAATFCATGAGAATAAQCQAALGSAGNIAGAGTASGTVIGDCGLDTNLDGVVNNLTEDAAGCATTCASTADPNPDDFKRVVVLVRWSQGDGSRFALESETMPYPGFSGAPRVTDLDPTVGSPFTNPLSPTAISWVAKTNKTASAVWWGVNGVNKGNATAGATNEWTFNWDIGTTSGSRTPNPGEVLDATYQITAKAFGNYGVFGPTRTETFTLNRRQAYPPSGVLVAQVGSVVKIAWLPNPEGDIEGYRIFRESSGDVEDITPSSSSGVLDATSTRDSAPPASGGWKYYVVAVDESTPGVLRDGDESEKYDVYRPNQSPSGPSTVTATRSGNTVTVTWTPGSDVDGSVLSYRVYRDGQELRDRYGNPVSASGTLSFTDSTAADGTHTYYVASVDDRGAESEPTGGVTS
jgi:prepilin-type N-terminal cleavage/methylation domain-containing protein